MRKTSKGEEPFTVEDGRLTSPVFGTSVEVKK